MTYDRDRIERAALAALPGLLAAPHFQGYAHAREAVRLARATLVEIDWQATPAPTPAPVDPGDIVVSERVKKAYLMAYETPDDAGCNNALRAAIAAWLAENPGAAPAPAAKSTPLDGVVPPKGYEWAAMDQDGEWWCYTVAPSRGSIYWHRLDGSEWQTFLFNPAPFDCPWDQSLHRYLGDGKWQHVGGKNDD